MKIIKPVAKFTLVTQLLFPLLYSASSVASAVNTKQEKASHREVLAKIQSNLPELTSKQADETHSMTGDELLAQGLNKSAQIISADNRLDAVENLAQSTAYGFASTQMTNWLNQYGNATIQISSDKAFSGEYFLPFYETEDNLFFSQSRIQRQDEDRTTLNLGLGYRYFMTNKMWGINSFYDRDLKNNHARLGLGAELGADYIKLAANSYFRLTDWRNSRLSAFHDYDERPANGFDIKAEGFLPSYPQLGANLKYEKYFGDNVNLKGSNSISDLKKDPQAYTVGISYTPVPLLSFSLNQSMGDVNQTKGELAVNYRFGVPLSQQLDTDLVPQMRTLMGARYNPVDRNNTIVMQYKEQELLRISFDKTLHEINSLQSATIPHPTIHKHKYDVKHVVYMSHDGLFDGKDTHTSKISDHSVVFKAPEFNSKSRSASNNTYEVYAYAEDVKGNRSNTVKLMVKVVNWVNVKDTDKAYIEASKENNTVTLTVTLKDNKGNPVTDKTVNIVQIDDNGKSSIVGIAEKNDDDTYKFTPTLDKYGNYKFGFTVNGEQATSTVEVEYKAESNGNGDKPSDGDGDKPSDGNGDKPGDGDGDKPSDGDGDKPSDGNGDTDEAIEGTLNDVYQGNSRIVINKTVIKLYESEKLEITVHLEDENGNRLKMDNIGIVDENGEDNIICPYYKDGDYKCEPIGKRYGKEDRFIVLNSYGKKLLESRTISVVYDELTWGGVEIDDALGTIVRFNSKWATPEDRYDTEGGHTWEKPGIKIWNTSYASLGFVKGQLIQFINTEDDRAPMRLMENKRPDTLELMMSSKIYPDHRPVIATKEDRKWHMDNDYTSSGRYDVFKCEWRAHKCTIY